MKQARLTVRLDVALRDRVRLRAESLGMAESEYVRETLDRDTGKAFEGPSVYDLMKRSGSIGIAKGLPPDLSTNKKYMEGFGRPRK